MNSVVVERAKSLPIALAQLLVEPLFADEKARFEQARADCHVAPRLDMHSFTERVAWPTFSPRSHST